MKSNTRRGLVVALLSLGTLTSDGAQDPAALAAAPSFLVTVKLVDLANGTGIDGVTVRVWDASNVKLSEGRTDSLGRYGASVGTSQVAVTFGKPGYLRPNERRPASGYLTLSAVPASNQVDGDLVDASWADGTAGKVDYYRSVADGMARKARNTSTDGQADVLRDEWSRISSLEADAKEAVAIRLMAAQPPGIHAIQDKLYAHTNKD
jgi:hypothetical protein